MRRLRTPSVLSLQVGPLSEGDTSAQTSSVRALYVSYVAYGPTRRLQDAITALCEAYGLAGLSFSGHLLRLELTSSHLPELPAGYCYKGGAARSALQRSLGRAFYIRDVDLLRFGSGWSGVDNEVSARFMERDWMRGHGVEISQSVDSYLGSRDLTINELYVGQGPATMTIGAFLDSVGFAIRPSRYRSGSLSRPRMLPSRTAAKIIRLKAEGTALGQPWTVFGLTAKQEVQLTDVAFELNKSVASKGHAAAEYVRLCVTAGLLPREIESVSSAVQYLIEEAPDCERLMPDAVGYEAEPANG